jgi:hypothetical protein
VFGPGAWNSCSTMTPENSEVPSPMSQA